MLVYIVGTFHNGIFEIAHVVSHQFSGEYDFHTHSEDSHEHLHDHHHSHDHGHSHDHEHAALKLTEKVFERFSHSPAQDKTEVEYSFEKLPQICQETSYKIPVGTTIPNNFILFDSELPKNPFLSIFSPPPESVA